jgi:hypothetical protein
VKYLETAYKYRGRGKSSTLDIWQNVTDWNKGMDIGTINYFYFDAEFDKKKQR